MHPLRHALLTFIVAAAAPLIFGGFAPGSALSFGLVAVFGNLTVDLIDHPLILIFGKGKFVRTTRSLIKQGRIVRALNFYYEGRKDGVRQVYLHNWAGIIVSLAVGVFVLAEFGLWHLLSAFVCFGIVMHFLQDMLETVLLGESFRLWAIRRDWR